jgi:hypothetical protein
LSSCEKHITSRVGPLQSHFIILFHQLMSLHCLVAASNLFQSVMETLIGHLWLQELESLEFWVSLSEAMYHVQAIIWGILDSGGISVSSRASRGKVPSVNRKKIEVILGTLPKSPQISNRAELRHQVHCLAVNKTKHPSIKSKQRKKQI